MNNDLNARLAPQTAHQQTLRKQAKALLPQIDSVLASSGYHDCRHLRLSHYCQGRVYQGLSQVTHAQFGTVMIKWQICNPDIQLDVPHPAAYTDLIHEAKVMSALAQRPDSDSDGAIVPPVLASGTVQISIPKSVSRSLPLGPSAAFTTLVMPYYQHGSVSTYLSQTATAHLKHRVIRQLAQQVARLHKAGWLHGDIKPSNVLVYKSITGHDKMALLLTDLALAQPVTSSHNAQSTLSTSAGTPAYLAPECWQAHGLSTQTDIYAVGITLYEILTGKRPYQCGDALKGASPTARRARWARLHQYAPVPRLPAQYQHYQAIIDRLLAKHSSQRYADLSVVVADIAGVVRAHDDKAFISLTAHL